MHLFTHDDYLSDFCLAVTISRESSSESKLVASTSEALMKARKTRESTRSRWGFPGNLPLDTRRTMHVGALLSLCWLIINLSSQAANSRSFPFRFSFTPRSSRPSADRQWNFTLFAPPQHTLDIIIIISRRLKIEHFFYLFSLLLLHCIRTHPLLLASTLSFWRRQFHSLIWPLMQNIQPDLSLGHSNVIKK